MTRRLAYLMALGTLVAAADAPPKQPPSPPAGIVKIPEGNAITIVGRTVDGIDGKDVGRVIDVLVDVRGEPQAAVIDFGGFMGLGNRKIAVDWRVLHFDPKAKNHEIRLDLSDDQLKDVPEYDPSAKIVPIAVPPPALPPAVETAAPPTGQ